MPRLTEQEQQEIIRYLEADKPLPDKFRFLLFEERWWTSSATTSWPSSRSTWVQENCGNRSHHFLIPSNSMGLENRLEIEGVFRP
jgi:hypothetical protein